MPQPLSRVRPKARIDVTGGAIMEKPYFAATAMRVIAAWAEIDGDMTIILSQMLNTDVKVATAMYEALNGGEARRTVFLAAAKAVLPEWQLLLLTAVLNATKPSRNQRNDFAHHIWGTVKELPDAILLMPPGVVTKRGIQAFRKSKVQQPATIVTPAQYDYSRIFVYRKNDFDRAVKEALEAAVFFAHLYGAIGLEVTEASRTLLLRKPRIQEALHPLIRGTSPEVQELLRSPADDEPPPKEPSPRTEQG